MTRAADEPASIDPISVEVLRHRLGAIAQDAGNAVERTAISPIITEAKDYAVGIFDAAGNLVAGAGSHVAHWPAQSHGIRAVIERYGDDISPGDIFLANDPHMGGGLHPGVLRHVLPPAAALRTAAQRALRMIPRARSAERSARRTRTTLP